MTQDMNDAPSGRDLRQRDLVPADRLASYHAAVIGVGAIGRQVALQLAALGVPRLVLYDDDIVSEENLAVQGYRPDQLTSAKVKATAEDCQRIYPPSEIIANEQRFRRSSVNGLVLPGSHLAVFCCVDAISTRKTVWESVRGVALFFVDGRMSGEVVRVLAVDCPPTNTYYRETLFAADRAFVGPCTARSTIYGASIAAGLMVGQFTKHLRGFAVDADITLNLLAAEWTVMS